MKLGPFAIGVERPIVRPWVFFEECTVGVGAGWPLDWYAQVELPDDVADVLVVVWPGVEWWARIDSLRRLARMPPAGRMAATRSEEDVMETQGEQGATGDEPLREEDVTRADGLNDDVREGDAGELPGDEPGE